MPRDGDGAFGPLKGIRLADCKRGPDSLWSHCKQRSEQYFIHSFITRIPTTLLHSFVQFKLLNWNKL